MIELFNNCGQWLSENAGSIVAFLTGTNFIAIVTSIVTVLKLFTSIKSNRKSIQNLDNSTIDLENQLKVLKDNEPSFVEMKDTIARVDNVTKSINDSYLQAYDVLNKKLNSMIEVQQLVYSTIKDDTLREHVQDVLMNAKFAEQQTRKELENKIIELTGIVNDLSTKLKSTVEDKAEEVKQIVTPSASQTIIPVRG